MGRLAQEVDIGLDSGTRRARVAGAIVCAVMVLGLLAFQMMEAGASSGRTIGIFVSSDAAEGLLITGVEPGLPAELAGLEEGDLIVEVDGRAIGSGGDYDASAAEFSSTRPVVFGVLRQGSVVTVGIQPGVPYPWQDLLLNALLTVFFLAIAVLSLLQEPWDIRARLLSAFTLAVALEFSLPAFTVGAPLLGSLVYGGYLMLTGLQVGLELHLAAVIPQPQPWLARHRRAVFGFYVLGGILGLTALAPFVADEIGRNWYWQSAQAERVLFELGMPIWALGVVALLARSALTYPKVIGRHQAALVLGGVLPWATFIVTTGVLGLIGAEIPSWLSAAEPIGLVCYPIAIFAAIFRYRLFDIELAVRRTLVYSVVTAGLVGISFLLIGVAGLFFARFLESDGSVWAVASASLVVGLFFAPFRRWVDRQVYKRFFPERLELRSKLTELAAELPTLGESPVMGKHLVDRLGEIFGVRWATLMLADPTSGYLATIGSSVEGQTQELESSLILPAKDPGLTLLSRAGKPFRVRELYAKSPSVAKRLQGLEASCLVPLTRESRLVGLLVLGPKVSGEEYRAEELELLSLLAHHVVSTLDNARLFESATRDSLTGLLRRGVILDVLEKELRRAVRHGRSLVIGMVDLDHFKAINDSYGHLNGDAVLRSVSSKLRAGLRRTDSIGRYGGEEFLFVLPETEIEGAVGVAEKIRALVEAKGLVMDDGSRVQPTISIGLSAVGPGEMLTARELISAADRSLYAAKQAGRNRVSPVLLSTG